MNNASPAKSRPPRSQTVVPYHEQYEVHLRVSAYDRVASLIVALLFLLGFAVVLLFFLWLTNRAFVQTPPIEIEYIDELAGGEAALGEGRDFEEPGLDEIQDLATPMTEELLAAVTDVTSRTQASSNAVTGQSSQGQGGGDRRRAGEGGNAAVPRWKRWEVQFNAGNISAYAKQLDAFRIELAAAGGGRDDVDYALNLSQSTPTTRSAPGDTEERLYMSYRSGKLQEFDRQLLQRAGVRTAGRIIVQFFPPDVEAQLAALERQQAGARPLKDIQKTVFGVQPSGGGFSFYVLDQQYR